MSYPWAHLCFTHWSNGAIKRHRCLTWGITFGGCLAGGHTIYPVSQEFVRMCLSFAALVAMGRDVSPCPGAPNQPHSPPAASSPGGRFRRQGWADTLTAGCSGRVFNVCICNFAYRILFEARTSSGERQKAALIFGDLLPAEGQRNIPPKLFGTVTSASLWRVTQSTPRKVGTGDLNFYKKYSISLREKALAAAVWSFIVHIAHGMGRSSQLPQIRDVLGCSPESSWLLVLTSTLEKWHANCAQSSHEGCPGGLASPLSIREEKPAFTVQMSHMHRCMICFKQVINSGLLTTAQRPNGRSLETTQKIISWKSKASSRWDEREVN